MKKWISLLTATVTLGMLTTPAYAQFANNANLPKLQQKIGYGGRELLFGNHGVMYLLTPSKILVLSAQGKVTKVWPIQADAILLSQDASTLYALQSKKNKIDILDAATGNVKNAIEGSTLNGYAMALSPDGTKIYVAGDQFSTVDLTTGDVTTNSGNMYYGGFPPTTDYPYSEITVSPSGNNVYMPAHGATKLGSGGNNMYTGFKDYNTITGDLQSVTYSKSPTTDSVAFDASGNRYVAGDGYVSITFANTGKTGNMDMNTADISSQMNDFLAIGTKHFYDGYSVYGKGQIKIAMFSIANDDQVGTLQFHANSLLQQLSVHNGDVYALTKNHIDVFGMPTASAPPAPPSSATGTSVTLNAGWNLVDSALVPSLTALSTDFWNGTSYTATAPNIGNAEWVHLANGVTEQLPPQVATSTAITVSKGKWSMIGNPFSQSATVALATGDKADVYSPNIGYQTDTGTTLTLAPGQGAWLYSASGGSYTVQTSSSSNNDAPPAPPSN